MSYRWSGPNEWLMDKSEGMNRDVARATVQRLVPLVSADDIQDAFQLEMDEDGYFEESSSA